jgi:hypothetical protein
MPTAAESVGQLERYGARTAAAGTACRDDCNAAQAPHNARWPMPRRFHDKEGRNIHARNRAYASGASNHGPVGPHCKTEARAFSRLQQLRRSGISHAVRQSGCVVRTPCVKVLILAIGQAFTSKRSRTGLMKRRDYDVQP